MKRAQEIALAWSLFDESKTLLEPGTHLWCCTKIGAGEQGDAIITMLRVLANRHVAVPEGLLAPLWDWMFGFVGSDNEADLRTLLGRLSVPTPPISQQRC